MPSRIIFVALFLAAIHVSSAIAQPAAVPAEEWSRRLLQRCLDQRQLEEESLSQLKREVSAGATAEEDLEFPEKEEAGRTQAMKNERARYFKRLSFLLIGDKADSLQPEDARSYGRGAERQPTEGSDPLQRTLVLLFGDTTACQLEAFQATLLFAYFNVPFTEERLNAAIRDEEVFREIERVFRAAGDSVVDRYLKFDRERARQAEDYVRQVMLRLTQIASIRVAVTRVQAAAVAGAQEAVTQELQKVLETPGNRSIPAETTKDRDEIEALLARMNTYIGRAAEPARIRAYVHARVDEFEETLRASFPEKQFNRLDDRVEQALFPNEAALIALQSEPAERIAGRANILIDEWFREDALPAVEESLFESPFSAYWFFVQTGGLPRAHRPYTGSNLLLAAPVRFSLDRIRSESTAAIIERLRRDRIPESFIAQHQLLETELREIVLSRNEAMDVIASAKLPAAQRQRLEAYLRDPNESDTVSSVDVYRWIIADSNKIRGAVDRTLVAAALELLRVAKQQRLEAYLANVGAGSSEDKGRLVGYLRNAGEMLLELERRQAVDPKFHQGTGAGVMGWLLGGFLLGNTVPIQLWVPGGVNGPEFTELMNELTPRNSESQVAYTGKEATRIRLVHDGAEYHEAAVQVINNAQNFLNVAAFDWKRDKGGRELTYRLMAKKLELSGADFNAFVDRFRDGLPIAPGKETTRFYDIPPPQMKNLLFYHYFQTSASADIRIIRETLQSLDVPFECVTVKTCGDLSALRRIAAPPYRPQQASDPRYAAVWELFRKIEGLFEKNVPTREKTKPRRSLAEYVDDRDDVRRFVEKFGAQRADDAGTPLPLHVIVDGKQTLIFNSNFGLSKHPPFVRRTPVHELYGPLMEFGADVVLWKGVLEFPWHIGPVPIPGRKVFGVIPMPFIPYPWLSAVPGFGWAGTGWSLFLQFSAATDPRNWWAMVTHVKHFSNEREALESGLGIGSKYNNEFSRFKTWHDMGVLVEGPIVDDANDYYVRIFNEARKNNAGNAGTKGVRVPRLEYEDHRSPDAQPAPGVVQNPSWFVTTDPEHWDFNYRAVLLSALASARENIYLESSFFSDPIVPRMLIRKAREFRGRVSCENLDAAACIVRRRDAVDIHLILPGASDKPILDTVATTDFHEMLHLGIKIYRWDPPEGWSSSGMLHTKAWLVDYQPGRGGLAYVGSENATQRSHLLDEEAGIVSTSPEFVKEVYARLFKPDIQEDSRIETVENFHVTSSTSWVIRSGRWIRRFLNSLFFI